MEDVNKRQRLSFSFPKLWHSPLEINSRRICQHLTNLTRWNKRDKDWSSANLLFKWRFRSRLRLWCLTLPKTILRDNWTGDKSAWIPHVLLTMYVIVRVVANTNRQLMYLISLSLLSGKITKWINRSAKRALNALRLVSRRCWNVGVGSAGSSIVSVSWSTPSSFS